jgi:hypothetical protein
MPPHLFVLFICDARPTEAILANDRAEAPHQRSSSVGRASQMNKTNKCGGMIVQMPLTKEILL